jgi:hypothetical protein
MSERIKDLLNEVADGVEPGERLEAIRAASGVRRPGRGWWTAGGVGLVAASVVTALALGTGGTPSGDPGPAGQPSTPSPTPDRTESLQDRKDRLEEMRRAAEAENGGSTTTVAAYYAGDTPDGLRLYREFRRVDADDAFGAAAAALSLPPEDPDYANLWPADAIQTVSFDGTGDDGVIGVTVDPTHRERPAGMTEVEAALAVEQVVRTVQAAARARAAVQFFSGGNPIDQVLGVPTSEPLAAGSDLAVLAHVSLSDPSEGLLVDNDEPFTVTGVGNSFEGNIVTRIQRLSGVVEVVAEEPAIAGTYEDRLFPFEVTFDLTTVPPGDYLVVSRTDDPSGEGRVHVDDRRITIVD